MLFQYQCHLIILSLLREHSTLTPTSTTDLVINLYFPYLRKSQMME